jgi:hypothetical protein
MPDLLMFVKASMTQKDHSQKYYYFATVLKKGMMNEYPADRNLQSHHGKWLCYRGGKPIEYRAAFGFQASETAGI